MVFAAGKTILSCIFQDGVDEKIGSEMQSGLPWGTQRSLRDTYHGPVPLCPLPLTADLEWAQSRRLILLGDALDCQAWLGSSMWPSPLWGPLGPQPRMCWASQIWSPPSCEGGSGYRCYTWPTQAQRGEAPGFITS